MSIEKPLTSKYTGGPEKRYSFSEVKSAIDYMHYAANRTVGLEREFQSRIGTPFPLYDSPLANDNYSLIERRGYDGAFKEVLGGKTIADYLKEHYGKRQLNIGEFGGPFRRASRDLERAGVSINESIGITLVDHRTEEERWGDAANSHTVLEANIFSMLGNDDNDRAGLDSVEEWLENKDDIKLDLIICRLGIALVDFNPVTEEEKRAFQRANLDEDSRRFINRPDANLLRTIFLKSVLRWYKFLSEDGTMLIECPGQTADLIKEMAKRVKTADGKTALEVEVDNYESDASIEIGIRYSSTELKLIKLKGSPSSIDLATVLGKQT